MCVYEPLTSPFFRDSEFNSAITLQSSPQSEAIRRGRRVGWQRGQLRRRGKIRGPELD